MKHKYCEEWKHISMHARNVFEYSNPSLLKCIAGFNHHGERMKQFNKMNTNDCFPAHREKETCDNIIKFEENKDKKEKFLEELTKKLKNV